MKKLFTFFAAAMVAIAVNAAISPGANALSSAIAAANPGDVIVLNSGDFTESSAITIDKNLTIKAADMKNLPVVKALKFNITGGNRLTFNGIKFDASEVTDNLIVAGDDAVNKCLYLENCYFYDYAQDDALVICGADNKLDSVVVDNCHFSNIKRSCIYLANTSAVGLIVTNSTFVNLVKGDSFNRAHIQALGASTRIEVDHCTFYNCQTMSTDYGVIGFQTDPCTNYLVQNCIFALPSDQSNIRAIYLQQAGGFVKNCLTHHYTKSDSNPGIHSGPSISGCLNNQDPKFADAANGDFTLAENSPAFKAGTDGKTLGDKRWWPVISYPKTDFAKEYAFTGTAASLESGLIKEDHWGAGREYIRYDGGMHSFAAASWTIEATRACIVKVKVYTATNEWEGHTSNPYGNSGHNFSVELWNEDSQRLDTIAEDVYQPSPWDGNRNYPAEGIELGNILVPEAGIYTIRLKNMRDFSRCGVDSVTFTYASDLPSAAAKGGWDSWANVLEFTLAKDAKTASVKKTFNKGDEFEFKMLINGTENENFRANGYWFKRDATTATGITGNGDNMKIIADYTGEYTFTWTFATNTLAVTFPEPTLENGWYLVGTFNEVDEWTVNELTADKKFEVNPENNDEFVITIDLKKDDRFKAAYVYLDEITEIKPAGTGNDYLVTEWTAGEKTIYYRVEYYQAWGGHFYIAPNEPTVTYSDFEIDLRQGQLGTEGSNLQKYLTVGEPYVYSDDMPIAYNAILNAARFNNAQDPSHGYVNFVATIPVEAGNYKITVGNCTYNSTNGAVKNEDGTETLDLIDKNGQTITAIETPKNCYHNNTTENVTSVWFVAEADQTIQIVCPTYAPYIKVEQVAEVPEEVIVYNVTFAHAEGATGVLPANLENIVPTTAITLPKNFSMYKEGYTFDGWTDGEDVYDPGFEYEVTDDVTFTAVYAENNTSLASRTEAVTIKWEFSQSKGVAPIDVSGTTTFVVAQATIGESKIDVKLPIDATAGKFVNSANSWTQINPGVIFSIPSAEDAVITYKQYDAGAVTTPEINVSATDATYQLVAAGTSGQLYYEYVQVVLPKPTATSISNTEASSKAQKLIENGQIVIIKNGVKYNVLGACLK